MDVVNILLALAGVAIAGIALYFAFLLLKVTLEILWMWAPLTGGIAAAIWLWKTGHDNISAICALGGILVQFFLWPAFKDKGGGGSHYDPLEGKTKLYDKGGNIIGGKDKE